MIAVERSQSQHQHKKPKAVIPRNSSHSALSEVKRNKSKVGLQHEGEGHARRKSRDNAATSAQPSTSTKKRGPSASSFKGQPNLELTRKSASHKPHKSARSPGLEEADGEEGDSWVSESSNANSPLDTPTDDTPLTSAGLSEHGTTPKAKLGFTSPKHGILVKTPTVAAELEHKTDFPFPSTSKTVPSSPEAPNKENQENRPLLGHRKTSTASTIAPSIRSLSQRRAPMTPSLKRSATALNPHLDLQGATGIVSPTLEKSLDQAESHDHNRTASAVSTATMSHVQSDLRRLRDANSPQNEKRRRVTSTGSSADRTGYFDSLRNLARGASSSSLIDMVTGYAVGVAKEPGSPSGSGGSDQDAPKGLSSALRKISPVTLGGSTTSSRPMAGPLKKASLSAVPKSQSPLISKFVTPSSMDRPRMPLISPAKEEAMRKPEAEVHHPPCSRTQHKLLMQKNAPLANLTMASVPHHHPGSTEACTINHQTGSLIPPQFAASSQPSTPSANSHEPEWHLNAPAKEAQHLQSVRLWAQAIVKEADRVDREHEFVRRFRDPIAESLQRIKEKKKQQAQAQAQAQKKTAAAAKK